MIHRLFITLAALLAVSANYASAQQVPNREATGDTRSIIRNIRVEIRDIFDDPSAGWLYQTANDLKVSTKEHVVRRELLFKEGEAFDEFLVEESERALRSLPFLREVDIVAIPDGNYVDVVVTVQDTWTLYPQASFVTGGGSGTTSIGLTEQNILGYGKRIELLYADDEGREKIEGVYDDQRLFGTKQQLLLGHFERSDGYRNINLIGRPFRSLVERSAWQITTDFSDTVGRLFEASDERFIYRVRHEEVAGRYIIARGDPEKLLHRYALGYEHTFDYFSEADEEDYVDADVDPNSVVQDPALLADDRKFSGPFIAYQSIAPDFISLNYVDRFERIQDFNLGNQFSFKVRYAGDVFGSDKDTFLFSGSDALGHRFSPTAFARGEFAIGTRSSRGGFDNTIARGELKYYNVLGSKYVDNIFLGKHTFAAAMFLDYGESLDRDREFLLGASDGLRGYKNRTFTGDKLFLLNLEQRIHWIDDLFRLISIGTVAFVDVGGTTDNALGNVFTDELYGDFGIGLRLGFPRASGSGIVRLDVAFPWRDGPDGSQRFEPRIYISTGQLFNAKLRSESSGPEQITVDAGIDR